MLPPEIDALFDRLPEALEKSGAAAPFADAAPVYIYGAGNMGKDLFRLLRARGVPVAGFLDRNAAPGSAWEGTPILKPEDEALSASQKQRSHVAIGVFNRDGEIPPIVKRLQSLGYGRVSSLLELHDRFAAELGDRLWLVPRRFYTTQREPIAAGYELWADEASRELYRAVLKFRLTMDYGALPAPSLHDQYFPASLPPWPSPLRLIDCGAYDGDTLRQVLDARLPVEAIAAFEPDPLNFSKLAQSLRSRAAGVTDTISLFPCGVGGETSQIRFSVGQGESSHASDQGDTVIQCVTLDEALPAFRPNLIKMDIEGAEYGALLGARRTIEEHRPGLAVCVYHQAEHLWTIPLLAASWLKGGRHYLRAHGHNGLELVYYWLP